ncbi:MAG TPA: hypothetical protein VKE74_24445 [Gemmataceae bacterium]|nr:hypothetical protein [Gemmataceae bacterium]
MIRKLLRSAVFAGLGMLAVLMSYGAAANAGDPKDDLPDISEIMKKGHHKTDGYLARIKAAAKDGKWEDASKDAKSLVLLGDALGKNKPPKGDPKSWEALTKKYQENTVAVEKAVAAKDVKGVDGGIGAIQKMCGDCHSQHKPK